MMTIKQAAQVGVGITVGQHQTIEMLCRPKYTAHVILNFPVRKTFMLIKVKRNKQNSF